MSARTAYLLFFVSLKPNFPAPDSLSRRNHALIVAYNYLRVRTRPSALRLVFVGFDAALAVLAHGALHTLAGNEEHGAPADVHAVIGDPFEVVDH